MNGLVIAAVGAALGLSLVLFARRGRSRRERFVYAVALAVAAAIYVLFGLAGGSARALAIEALGLAAFGAVAAVGLRRGDWILAAGWLAHVAWDVVLHGPGALGYAPEWYPMLCVGFDLVLAARLAALASATRQRR